MSLRFTNVELVAVAARVWPTRPLHDSLEAMRAAAEVSEVLSGHTPSFITARVAGEIHDAAQAMFPEKFQSELPLEAP
jgi:hypothetical protein